MRIRSLVAPALLLAAACARPSPAPVAVAGVTSASATPTAPAPIATGAATASNAFASDLHARLAVTPGNLFYSPASIALALGMTREGARAKTATEMDTVLHLTGTTPGVLGSLSAIATGSGDGVSAPEVRIANKLWVDGTMKLDPAYAALTKSNYAASADAVDFRGAADPTRLLINAWVATQTKDKITDLLAPGTVTRDTRLAITNAIYFKGTWRSKFDPRETAPAPFLVSATASHPVPMMHQSTNVRFGETDGAQVFELGYAGPADKPGMSMVVILPKDRAGLPAIEDAVAHKGFAPFVASMTSTDEGDVWLPKLKMTVSFALGDTLKKMGMPTAFSDDADFSGITPGGGIKISHVIHKAFVELDEKGTEAAAATAVLMTIESASIPRQLRADHPFLFLIKDDKTGAIVFVGRCADPAAP
jgi:serpin B